MVNRQVLWQLKLTIVHILAEGDKDYCRLIFDTRTIARLAKKYIGTLKNGGDG